MAQIKEVLSNNLISLRKAKKLTQGELAQSLKYSDKTISKWEIGEAIPDVETLFEISKFYNVSMDSLVCEKVNATQKQIQKDNNNKIIISLLSVSLIWILATLGYVYIQMITKVNYWMVFVWAAPLSFIVLIVFNAIWGRRKFSFWLTSCLTWTIILGLFFQFLSYHPWPVFLIGAPVQIAIVLWAQLKPKNKKK